MPGPCGSSRMRRDALGNKIRDKSSQECLALILIIVQFGYFVVLVKLLGMGRKNIEILT